MANPQNLRVPTSEEASRMGKKGGRRSGESKRKKKAMREQMELLLSLPLLNKNDKEELSKYGLKDEDMNNQMFLVLKTYEQALKGDIRAVNAIRELIGERVVELNVNTVIDEKAQALKEELDKY